MWECGGSAYTMMRELRRRARAKARSWRWPREKLRPSAVMGASSVSLGEELEVAAGEDMFLSLSLIEVEEDVDEVGVRLAGLASSTRFA